jgi:hypothetical protein
MIGDAPIGTHRQNDVKIFRARQSDAEKKFFLHYAREIFNPWA